MCRGTFLKFYRYAGRVGWSSPRVAHGVSRRGAIRLKPLHSPHKGSPGTMRAEIWKAVQKLYAVGILVHFAAAGIVGVSISDFSDWASFMGRHAVYAFAWPVAAGAEIDSWRGPSGLPRWLR